MYIYLKSTSFTCTVRVKLLTSFLLLDTSASLRALRALWPGNYKVAFIIKDQQGVACPDAQKLEIHVCSCEGGGTCKAANVSGRRAFQKSSPSSFGGLGVGALILGLLTLLSECKLC